MLNKQKAMESIAKALNDLGESFMHTCRILLLLCTMDFNLGTEIQVTLPCKTWKWQRILIQALEAN